MVLCSYCGTAVRCTRTEGFDVKLRIPRADVIFCALTVTEVLLRAVTCTFDTPVVLSSTIAEIRGRVLVANGVGKVQV